MFVATRWKIGVATLFVATLGLLGANRAFAEDDWWSDNLQATQWHVTPNHVCAECHPKQAADYAKSGMAQAATDTLYLAIRKRYGEKYGAKTVAGCIACHSMTATQQGEQDPRTSVDKEGVGCAFCHAVKALKHPEEVIRKPQGFVSYTVDDGTTMYSAMKPEQVSPSHKMDVNPLFHKSEFCYGCHGSTRNFNGLSVCTTPEEFVEWNSKAGTNLTCQDCHMPKTVGRVSTSSTEDRPLSEHSFHGANSVEMLQSSADINVAVVPDGRSITVAVTNKAGHKLPSGIPDRYVTIDVNGYDIHGKRIWKNNAPEDDEGAKYDSVLRIAFKDSAGNAGGPPRFATAILYDNRLNAGEQRILHFDVPPEVAKEMTSVKAQLWFHAFRERRVRDELKLNDEFLLHPHLISESTWQK